MKKLITILSVVLFSTISAQISPIITTSYTGGLSYYGDHEYASIGLGVQKDLQEKQFYLIDKFQFTTDVLYDYYSVYARTINPNSNSKFAAFIKMTSIKRLIGDLGVTYSFGVGGTVEKIPSGMVLYGVGLTTMNLPFNLGAEFQNIQDDNYLSVTATFDISKIFKSSK